MGNAEKHLGEINLAFYLHSFQLNPRLNMKRRITFVQRQDAPFEANQAVLTTKTLSIRDLDAAREDRVTFGLEDLPAEVRGNTY